MGFSTASSRLSAFLATLALALTLTATTSHGKKVFMQYESSPWEQEWIENIAAWRDLECQTMGEPRHLERAKWAVYKAQLKNRFNVTNNLPATAFRDEEIFSKMIYHCNGHKTLEYIEPLVGILRDPLTMCPNIKSVAGYFQNGESWVQAKRYQLYEPAATVDTPLSHCEENLQVCSRRLLFDLGASTYHGWGSDRSAIGSKWFVQYFARFNTSFDHIYAFEFTPRPPSQIFRDLPIDILARYSYYNLGVSAEIGDVWNVWTFIKEIARPEDYIIVKLDIDSPNIEGNFITQLINDTDLLGLVDVGSASRCLFRLIPEHSNKNRSFVWTYKS